MSKTQPRSSRINRDTRNLLVSKFDTLQALYPPDETWSASETNERIEGMVDKLLACGVIQRVGRAESGCWEYQTEPGFWRELQAHKPRSPKLPCGHHGIHNIRGGGYECKAGWCDAEFDKETVEEVMGLGQ